MMSPLQAAARFAAFVWYTNNREAPSGMVQEEARRFARAHWQAFLPVAQEGLGRLLLRVAKPRRTRPQRRLAKRRSASARYESVLSA